MTRVPRQPRAGVQKEPVPRAGAQSESRSRVPAAGQSLLAGSAVPTRCTGHWRCRQRALCGDSYLPISGGSWCSGAAAGLSSGAADGQAIFGHAEQR